ncbi:MAG: hypothetical protein HZB31_09480 [Nitrospirae bacterium]|nr:hypothetical protein [Nitrospirota bacterium]
MPHGTDGIGKPKWIDPATLLRDKAAGNRPGNSATEFGQLLKAEIRQQKDLRSSALAIKSPALLIEKPAASASPPPNDSFKEILKVVLKHEGSSYVKKDGMRESSKMGILQSTANEFGYKGDIKDLTRADAEAIYKKIWNRSGAAKLPYPLSLIHFDTYVNSPAAARKILAKSEGNVDTYLDMRGQRFQRLAQRRPARFGRYLKGWMARVDHLKQISTEYAQIHETGSAQKTVQNAQQIKPSKG